MYLRALLSRHLTLVIFFILPTTGTPVVENMLQLGPLRRHFDRDMAAGTGEAGGDGSHERAMMRALRALFEDNWDPLAGAAVLNPSGQPTWVGAVWVPTRCD